MEDQVMKKIVTMLAAVAALVSCTERGLETPAVGPEEDVCSLSIAVDTENESGTKAPAAYTASKDYESAVKKVQIFVFDSDGKLNAYVNAGTSLTATIDVSYGTKDVWAVVNGEDLGSITSKTGLLSHTVSLGTNSTDVSKGFVMAGNASVTLSGPTASAPITVSRLVSRVALVSVRNEMPAAYGSISVVNAFLANVVGNENIAGNASPSIWYNMEGRSDTTPRAAANIINGGTYAASEAALTYKQIGQSVSSGTTHDVSSSPYLVYAYKNSSAVAPSGFHSTFSAQKTALIVTIVISGTTYYYPVVMDSLERNKSYTVALTLKGLGSEDPDTPIQKGAISAAVTVAGWTSGAVYDENI